MDDEINRVLALQRSAQELHDQADALVAEVAKKLSEEGDLNKILSLVNRLPEAGFSALRTLAEKANRDSLQKSFLEGLGADLEAGSHLLQELDPEN